MPSYVTPKKGVQYITFVGLVSQADTKLLKVNPTIAAGDFKVSIDGGALANLATLPSVAPAGSSMVKITLSTSEMNGDNVTVVCSDASGAEWCDLLINIQTSARQVDDLAFPTVAGRSLDVTATGAAGIDWANVENPTTALNLSGTNIATSQSVASVSGAVASVTGAVGSVTGSVGSVTGNVGGSVASVTAGVTVTTNNDKTGYSLSAAAIQAIWDALASALTTVGSIGKRIADNLDAAITSRLAPTVATRTLDVSAGGEAGIDWANIGSPTTVVGLSGTTIKTATDVETDTADIQSRLPSALVSGRIDSSVGAMAANTMTAAAAAADLTTELQTGLATAASITTLTGYVDTEVAAIKAKTDNLPASPAAVSDIPTAAQNADALLDRTDAIEVGLTPRQAQRLIAAAAAGILSGAATTTITIRNAVANSKNRLIATVDTDGNRSAITYDLT